MPKYTIRDPKSGRTVVLTGDSPPTAQELEEIFSKINASPAPAAASAPEPAAEQPGALRRFVGGVAKTLLPTDRLSDVVEGPMYAARHPIDSINLLWDAISGAHKAQAGKTVDAARRVISEPTIAGKMGAASEAAGHGLATVLPLVGPAAANAGESIAEGDIAGGIGQGVGLLAPMAAGRAKVPVRVPGIGKANPVAARALEFAERRGVPLDAATSTQRPIVRSLQKATADNIGGAGKAEAVQRAQAERLSTVGRELAEQAHPASAVSPEQAGQALRDGVQQQISTHHKTASEAYGKLRQIEADPVNSLLIAPELKGSAAAMGAEVPAGRTAATKWPDLEAKLGREKVNELRQAFEDDTRAASDAGRSVGRGRFSKDGSTAQFRKWLLSEQADLISSDVEWQSLLHEGRAALGPAAGVKRFAKQGASTDDLWQGVLGDARRNGFTGSADDLKAEFYDRLSSAKSLAADTNQGHAEYSSDALLKEIRKAGGLQPFEKSFEGGQVIKKYGEERTNSSDFAHKGQRGGASIYRNDGLQPDQMVEYLQQDPRWQHITDVQELRDAIREAATAEPTGKAATGASFGSKGVEHYLEAAGVRPGAKWWGEKTDLGGAKEMALPIDLREAKAALRPVLEQMQRQLPITQQRSSPGLKAIENIVNGPDHAPLTQVDTDLGIIKGISRGADLPELRDISQGLAARAVKVLEKQVRDTAEMAGPEAAQALQTGRKATVQKYKASDVLKKLRTEPVQTFQQATFAKDAGIAALREVAKTTPDAMPKVGRAFLDDLMSTATADGGFSKAATVHTKWKNLGEQTKLLLFKDPAYITELDNFFRLAEMVGDNPNPSGTSRVLNATKVAAAPGFYLASKLLYTRRGVKLLTNGLRAKVPLGGTRAAAAGAASATRPKPVVPVTAEDKRKQGEQAIR